MSDVKRVRVSDVDFVKALKDAVDNDATLTDVAESLEMKPLSVYQRYSKLRKAGVAIPHIPMNEPKTLDVAALSSIFG